jgi:hypothetical protein
VTLTWTVHVPFVVPTLAGMVAPVGLPKIRLVAPANGAQVGVPPQVVLALGVAATCTPAGSASVKVTPVSATLFSLLRVKTRVDVPLIATGVVENALASVGGIGTPQPVMMISSTYMYGGVCEFLAWPAPMIRKDVVPDPVVVAATGPREFHEPLLMFVSPSMLLHAPPFALEYA